MVWKFMKLLDFFEANEFNEVIQVVKIDVGVEA